MPSQQKAEVKEKKMNHLNLRRHCTIECSLEAYHRLRHWLFHVLTKRDEQYYCALSADM